MNFLPAADALPEAAGAGEAGAADAEALANTGAGEAACLFARFPITTAIISQFDSGFVAPVLKSPTFDH